MAKASASTLGHPSPSSSYDSYASLCVLLQEYLELVDPGSHLGLNEQSIAGYWLSKTFRTIRKSFIKVMVVYLMYGIVL